MAWDDIVGIGFITINTKDLNQSLEFAEDVVGLNVVAKDAGSVSLSGAAGRPEIIYRQSGTNSLGHMSIEARNEDAVARVRSSVSDAGFRLHSSEPLEEGVGHAFSFVGPDEMLYEIFSGYDKEVEVGANFGPDRYGHVNLHPTDVGKTKDFLTEILGFKVSDAIGTEAYFLRCCAEHHGIALIQGRGALHHHAWAVQSIAELGRIADRLDQTGHRILWGPVRHGAGNNIAIYFEEPTGCVIEIYCDMEQIYDDDRPAVVWQSDDPRWYNRWMDFRPQDFRRFGIELGNG